MALTLNSTTGISGVDGSASSPALQGSDSNTGINFGSDTVNINTGGVTRATVDSAGRMLIGTSTESNTNLTIFGDGTGDNKPAVIFQNSSTGTGSTNGFYVGGASNDTNGYVWNYESSNVVLATANTERMRINDTGHVMIRTTSTGTDNSHSANFNIDGYLTLNHINGAPSGRAYLAFNYNAGEIGTVTQNGTSGVSYNTSSDYRLKENIVALSDGITRLKTLKPSRFNFKTEKDRTVDGFIAHEVTAVPEAITGTKDEVDSDNNPVYQGIDQSKLVPLLVAALQEAVGRIEALEAK